MIPDVREQMGKTPDNGGESVIGKGEMLEVKVWKVIRDTGCGMRQRKVREEEE